jgi:hypothetical protein
VREREPESKFRHASVDFEHPAKGEDHCGECQHFIKAEPPRCQIVASPIAAEDWCRKFKEQPGESAAYEREEKREYAKEHK